ncbi:MAG: HAMP domain-containing histidine kinase [Bacteroidaceae bacterium]|nr:HAMP domain-containing histidine kinase [Bacteroidaceae bacterium]
MMLIASIFVLIVVIAAWLFVRHQRSLRRRAHLMREAIRNHDWSFRLNTRGLTSGERAMQETLNDLGEVIHQQVNQSEVESWERLARVLTHEMMNSTAPIASISQSLLRRDDVAGTPLEAGIRSINATATRLTTFVESYRKLAQLQQPKPEDVHLDAFFAEVQRLYPQLAWDVVGMDDVIVHTDPVLLQQVVVNLVKNAVEAGARRIKTHPQPLPSGRGDLRPEGEEHGAASPLPDGRGRGWVFFLSNDGAPIPAVDRDSIFIPFFTTKHGGTGIGLALSRQIMVRQGGDLELMDQPETGYAVTFRLTLPCA